LGVTINSKGSFKPGAKRLKDKTAKAYVAWKRNFNTFNNTNVYTLCKLFDSLCKPILLYGSEVWGAFCHSWKKSSLAYFINLTSHLFEKFHVKFCKQSLGLTKLSPTLAAKAELGRFPLSITVVLNILRNYHHLLNISDDSLAKLALLNQVSLNQTSVDSAPNFIKTISTICMDLGLNLNNGHLSEKRFGVTLNFALAKLKEMALKEVTTFCTRQIENSGKLAIWCNIKQNITREKYLDFVRIPEQRIALSKIRLSNHKLPIERGRFSNPKIPRNERICNLCPQIKVGDEFHLICECSHPKLFYLRKVLFCEISNVCPSFELLNLKNKFVYLLCCNDKDITRIFAKICFKMLKVGEKF